MQVPVVNAQQAGAVAASADMNNYAYACKFLLQAPAVQAFAQSSAQSLTGGAAPAIIWAQPKLDNDGTWAAGSPDRFTIMTLGFYEVAAHIIVTSAAVSGRGNMQVTTGPNNPQGSGVITANWRGSFVNGPGAVGTLALAGIIPQLCYPGDFIQIVITPTTTCTTTSLNGSWSDYSHKLVSL